MDEPEPTWHMRPLGSKAWFGQVLDPWPPDGPSGKMVSGTSGSSPCGFGLGDFEGRVRAVPNRNVNEVKVRRALGRMM